METHAAVLETDNGEERCEDQRERSSDIISHAIYLDKLVVQKFHDEDSIHITMQSLW